MTAVGRPTLYQSSYNRQAFKLCLLGATDSDLASFFDVSDATIDNWKATYPRFLGSIKRGKQQADAQVAKSLYHRALGYSHDAVKIITVANGNNQGSSVESVPYIEHYPPDTTAAIFWLKNRRPEQWRERSQIDVKHGLDDSLTALLAASFTGQPALPIVECQVIEEPTDATIVTPDPLTE